MTTRGDSLSRFARSLACPASPRAPPSRAAPRAGPEGRTRKTTWVTASLPWLIKDTYILRAAVATRGVSLSRFARSLACPALPRAPPPWASPRARREGRKTDANPYTITKNQDHVRYSDNGLAGDGGKLPRTKWRHRQSDRAAEAPRGVSLNRFAQSLACPAVPPAPPSGKHGDARSRTTPRTSESPYLPRSCVMVQTPEKSGSGPVTGRGPTGRDRDRDASGRRTNPDDAKTRRPTICWVGCCTSAKFL